MSKMYGPTGSDPRQLLGIKKLAKGFLLLAPDCGPLLLFCSLRLVKLLLFITAGQFETRD